MGKKIVVEIDVYRKPGVGSLDGQEIAAFAMDALRQASQEDSVPFRVSGVNYIGESTPKAKG